MKQDRMTEKNESGRSLTEMLGVLAVMGVLTIGAIAGFNYAMNKQRANATVNYVNQLAIEGSRQMLAGSNHLSLLDYPDKTPSGYGVELGLLSDTNAYFEVYVKEVPEAVCSQIQAMAEGWRGLDTLWINEDGKDCNKETNTMSFIFTDSLSRGTSGTRCTSDEGCTGCQTCQRGFCTDNNDSCPGDSPYCRNGYCESCITPCSDDKPYCVKGICNECPPDTPIWLKNGSCVGCNDDIIYEVDERKQHCSLCDNRHYLSARAGYIGYCAPNNCPDNKPLMGYNGTCHSCDETVQMSHLWTTPRLYGLDCLACPKSGLAEWRCMPTCPDLSTNKNGVCVCPADKPVMSVSLKASIVSTAFSCSPCDELKSITVWQSSTECGKCPNRTYKNYYAGYKASCYLTTCPAGYYHTSVDMDCVACPADTSGLTAEQQAECGGASP